MWYFIMFFVLTATGFSIGYDVADNNDIPMQDIGKAIEACQPNGGLKFLKANGKTAVCVNDVRITFK